MGPAALAVRIAGAGGREGERENPGKALVAFELGQGAGVGKVV